MVPEKKKKKNGYLATAREGRKQLPRTPQEGKKKKGGEKEKLI